MQVIREAIYDRLAGAIMYGSPPAAVAVYDAAPEPGNAAPASRYISLGETTREAWDTDTSIGAKVRVRLEVYSGYVGSKEADQIAELCRARLNRYTFTLSGCHFVSCTCEDGSYETTEDNKTRRTAVDVEFLVDDIT